MRLSDQSGFTLIELLVTMLITTIVFGATLSVLDVFQKDNRVNQLREETLDGARNSMDRLSRELRNVAAPSSEFSGALELAESYNVVFQTIEGVKTRTIKRIRYCLDDSNSENEVLYRQIKTLESSSAPLPSSTACPDTSTSDYEATSRLAEHIVNRWGGQTRVLFTYGPATATKVSEIVSVEPSLYLDLNPGNRPGESQLTSSISLRNENRPPAASFTAAQQGSKRVVELNASESSDPDGLALTYKWWDNGTKLQSTAQQVTTGEETAGTKHTFKLEVTDPGGLKSEATKELTISS